MPEVKTRRDDEGTSRSSSKRRRRGCHTTEEEPPRQHLYLILDDWALGYTIRALDLSSSSSVPAVLNGVARSAALSLPSPLLRLQARRESPMFFAAALGSKILVMHPKEDRSNQPSAATSFDIHTRSLTFVPRPTDNFSSFYFSIGSRLLALGSSFQLLDLHPMDDPSSGGQLDSLAWRKLQDPPFHPVEVMSYAILPDRQTIFVSVGMITKEATFSFQIADDGIECRSRSNMWETVGDWVLPFDGPGHFDSTLNAWIGLSMNSLEPGHICACDLWSGDSSIDGRESHCPTWKFSKECLFSDDPAETHVGATLVHLGHGSRFCLVECIVIYYYKGKKGVQHPEAFQYMYRFTTFSLKYDKNGDLTTGGTQLVRYYRAPKEEVTRFVCENPVAFWM